MISPIRRMWTGLLDKWMSLRFATGRTPNLEKGRSRACDDSFVLCHSTSTPSGIDDEWDSQSCQMVGRHCNKDSAPCQKRASYSNKMSGVKITTVTGNIDRKSLSFESWVLLRNTHAAYSPAYLDGSRLFPLWQSGSTMLHSTRKKSGKLWAATACKYILTSIRVKVHCTDFRSRKMRIWSVVCRKSGEIFQARAR